MSKKKTSDISLGVALAAALLLAVSGCIVVDSPEETGQTTSSSSLDSDTSSQEATEDSGEAEAAVEPADSGMAGMGDTITISNVDFTLNSAEASTEGQLSTSPDEDIFLILDLTVVNNSSDEIALSSIMSFSLKGSDSYEYDLALFVDTKGSLDTTVAPGSTVRGQIAFDVPELDSYEFSVTPGLLSDNGYFKVIAGDNG
jgi:hypothetical protein